MSHPTAVKSSWSNYTPLFDHLSSSLSFVRVHGTVFKGLLGGGVQGRGGGGGELGSKYAYMCVSKSEGHGSFFSFKGVK